MVGPDSQVGFEVGSEVGPDDRRSMLSDIGAARPFAEQGYRSGQDAIDAGLADRLAE